MCRKATLVEVCCKICRVPRISKYFYTFAGALSLELSLQLRFQFVATHILHKVDFLVLVNDELNDKGYVEWILHVLLPTPSSSGFV